MVSLFIKALATAMEWLKPLLFLLYSYTALKDGAIHD